MAHASGWTTGGNAHRIDTICGEGQTPERCKSDHDALVAAAKVMFPPDTGSEWDL